MDVGPVGGVDDGRGEFSFGLRSRNVLGGPLQLEWYAVLSAGQGHVEALVLLFAQDQRTIPIEGGEYLLYEFIPSPDGTRAWVSRGWASSEMGEWDGYRQLSEVCRRRREVNDAPTAS